MKKQIIIIGFEIPGHSDKNINFYNEPSLMDADILLISTDSLYPKGDWVSFTTSDGGCYNISASRTYKQKMFHLRKEMKDYLDSGKSVFILLSKKEEYQLAYSVSTPKKGQHNFTTETYNNYNFLPIDIGKLTSATGSHIKFSGNLTFSDFYNKFKEYLEYQVYIENAKDAYIIFTGKDKTKILGAIYKVGAGHLIVLPMLTFNEQDFMESMIDEEDERWCWNKKGIAFGNNLIKCLLEIDSKLTDGSDKTPTPEWIFKEQFSSKKEIKLNDLVAKNCAKIIKIEQKNEKLKAELGEEIKLKDLLFEQGKLLENAVIKALRILGYQAENYDDGNLEMDQIITSPEKHRYIGESEGKDSKDIDVTKFRQLVDALNADFARDLVKERALGILFGNAERLKDPSERKLDFTTKCKSGAEREKIALIKTVDLFHVANYLNENIDEKFKTDCRNAIHKQLGKVVVFPAIPKA